ncbi:MAG: hypothetical protein KKD79_06990 [Candidatus Omnitrophica bacterium]|nr:hypothetical protein [Candidatus Omnitrophota bacterium]
MQSLFISLEPLGLNRLIEVKNKHGFEAAFFARIRKKAGKEEKIFVFRYRASENSGFAGAYKIRDFACYEIATGQDQEIFAGGLTYVIPPLGSQTAYTWVRQQYLSFLRYYPGMQEHAFFVAEPYRRQYFLGNGLLALAVQYMKRCDRLSVYNYAYWTPSSMAVLLKLLPDMTPWLSISHFKNERSLETLRVIREKGKSIILSSWLKNAFSPIALNPLADKQLYASSLRRSSSPAQKPASSPAVNAIYDASQPYPRWHLLESIISTGKQGDIIRERGAAYCIYVSIFDALKKKGALIHADIVLSKERAREIVLFASEKAEIALQDDAYRQKNIIAVILRSEYDMTSIEFNYSWVFSDIGLPSLPTDIHPSWQFNKIIFSVGRGEISALGGDGGILHSVNLGDIRGTLSGDGAERSALRPSGSEGVLRDAGSRIEGPIVRSSSPAASPLGRSSSPIRRRKISKSPFIKERPKFLLIIYKSIVGSLATIAFLISLDAFFGQYFFEAVIVAAVFTITAVLYKKHKDRIEKEKRIIYMREFPNNTNRKDNAGSPVADLSSSSFNFPVDFSHAAGEWIPVSTGEMVFKATVGSILIDGKNVLLSQPLCVCKKILSNPGFALCRNIVAVLLDEYFRKKNEYTIAHIPIPGGWFKEGYFYFFVRGTDGFSWEVMTLEGRENIQMQEWNICKGLFWKFGIDIGYDIVNAEDALSKNIIIEGYDIEQLYLTCSLSKYWTRIDFGYESLPIRLNRLQEAIREDKASLRKVLGWRFKLLECAAYGIEREFTPQQKTLFEKLFGRYQLEELEQYIYPHNIVSSPVTGDTFELSRKDVPRLAAKASLKILGEAIEIIESFADYRFKLYLTGSLAREIIRGSKDFKVTDVDLALGLSGRLERYLEVLASIQTQLNLEFADNVHLAAVRYGRLYKINDELKIKDTGEILGEGIYDRASAENRRKLVLIQIDRNFKVFLQRMIGERLKINSALEVQAVFPMHIRPFVLLCEIASAIKETRGIDIYITILNEIKEEVLKVSQALGDIKEANRDKAAWPVMEAVEPYRSYAHGVFYVSQTHYFRCEFFSPEGEPVHPDNDISSLLQQFLSNTIIGRNGIKIDVSFPADEPDKEITEAQKAEIFALIGYLSPIRENTSDSNNSSSPIPENNFINTEKVGEKLNQYQFDHHFEMLQRWMHMYPVICGDSVHTICKFLSETFHHDFSTKEENSFPYLEFAFVVFTGDFAARRLWDIVRSMVYAGNDKDLRLHLCLKIYFSETNSYLIDGAANVYDKTYDRKIAFLPYEQALNELGYKEKGLFSDPLKLLQFLKIVSVSSPVTFPTAKGTKFHNIIEPGRKGFWQAQDPVKLVCADCVGTVFFTRERNIYLALTDPQAYKQDILNQWEGYGCFDASRIFDKNTKALISHVMRRSIPAVSLKAYLISQGLIEQNIQIDPAPEGINEFVENMILYVWPDKALKVAYDIPRIFRSPYIVVNRYWLDFGFTLLRISSSPITETVSKSIGTVGNGASSPIATRVIKPGVPVGTSVYRITKPEQLRQFIGEGVAKVKEYWDHAVAYKITGNRERLSAYAFIYTYIRGVKVNGLYQSVGGTRHKRYPNEVDAIIDGLELSRDMTYKNALAGIPLGGAKAVLMNKDKEILKIFALTLEALGVMLTGQDVGISEEDVNYMAGFGPHVICGTPDRALGGEPTAPYTSLGLYHATIEMIKVAHERRILSFHSPNLKDYGFGLQGLGAVGSRVLEHLLNAGARVYATDEKSFVMASIAREHCEAISSGQLILVRPQEIYKVKGAQIFLPCALGGVLNNVTIPWLSDAGCKMIISGANNDLDKPEEYYSHLILEKGMIHMPGFGANSGGVLAALCKVGGYDLIEKVTQGIPARVRQIVEISLDERRPSYVVAKEIAKKIVRHSKIDWQAREQAASPVTRYSADEAVKRWIYLWQEIKSGQKLGFKCKDMPLCLNIALNIIKPLDSSEPQQSIRLTVVDLGHKRNKVQAWLTYHYDKQIRLLTLAEIKGSRRVKGLGAVLVLEAISRHREAEQVVFSRPKKKGRILIKKLEYVGIICSVETIVQQGRLWRILGSHFADNKRAYIIWVRLTNLTTATSFVSSSPAASPVENENVEYLSVESKIMEGRQDIIDALSKGKQPPLFEVQFHPSAICNNRCLGCIGTAINAIIKSDGRNCNALLLSREQFSKAFADIREYNAYITRIPGQRPVERLIFSGLTGEPTCNRYAIDALREAAELGFHNTLLTNGRLLNNDRKKEIVITSVNDIIVSLYGATAKAYGFVAGVDESAFRPLIENIRGLVQIRNIRKLGSKIGIAFLIERGNYKGVIAATKIAYELGVDFIRFRAIMQANERMLAPEQWKECEEGLSFAREKYETDSFKVMVTSDDKKTSPNAEKSCLNCVACQIMPVIGPDFKVYPCPHLSYFGAEDYGSLENSSLIEILTGERSKRLIERIVSNPTDIVCSPRRSRINELFKTIKSGSSSSPVGSTFGSRFLVLTSTEHRAPSTEGAASPFGQLSAIIRQLSAKYSSNSLPAQPTGSGLFAEIFLHRPNDKSSEFEGKYFLIHTNDLPFFRNEVRNLPVVEGIVTHLSVGIGRARKNGLKYAGVAIPAPGTKYGFVIKGNRCASSSPAALPLAHRAQFYHKSSSAIELDRNDLSSRLQAQAVSRLEGGFKQNNWYAIKFNSSEKLIIDKAQSRVEKLLSPYYRKQLVRWRPVDPHEWGLIFITPITAWFSPFVYLTYKGRFKSDLDNQDHFIRIRIGMSEQDLFRVTAHEKIHSLIHSGALEIDEDKEMVLAEAIALIALFQEYGIIEPDYFNLSGTPPMIVAAIKEGEFLVNNGEFSIIEIRQRAALREEYYYKASYCFIARMVGRLTHVTFNSEPYLTYIYQRMLTGAVLKAIRTKTQEGNVYQEAVSLLISMSTGLQDFFESDYSIRRKLSAQRSSGVDFKFSVSADADPQGQEPGQTVSSSPVIIKEQTQCPEQLGNSFPFGAVVGMLLRVAHSSSPVNDINQESLYNTVNLILELGEPKNYALALVLLDELFKYDPQDIRLKDIYLDLAGHKRGYVENAIDKLEEIIKAPNFFSPVAHYIRAILNFDKGNFKECIADLDEAVRLSKGVENRTRYIFEKIRYLDKMSDKNKFYVGSISLSREIENSVEELLKFKGWLASHKRRDWVVLSRIISAEALNRQGRYSEAKDEIDTALSMEYTSGIMKSDPDTSRYFARGFHLKASLALFLVEELLFKAELKWVRGTVFQPEDLENIEYLFEQAENDIKMAEMADKSYVDGVNHLMMEELSLKAEIIKRDRYEQMPLRDSARVLHGAIALALGKENRRRFNLKELKNVDSGINIAPVDIEGLKVLGIIASINDMRETFYYSGMRFIVIRP